MERWSGSPSSGVAELDVCGLEVPDGLVEGILSHPAEALAPLCVRVGERARWSARGAAAWAPIHALHLLGALADSRSLPYLVRLLRWEEVGDWLFGSVPGVLALMGPAAVEPLTALVKDELAPLPARLAAFDALYALGSRHPEVRDTLEPIFRYFSQREGEPILGAMARCVVALIEGGDGTAPLRSLFGDLDRVKSMLPPGVDPGRIRGKPWNHMSAFDPLAHFAPTHLAELAQVTRDSGEGWWRGGRPRPSSWFDDVPEAGAAPEAGRPQVGRNDPCPCGSGRLYRKCCLPAS